MNKILLQKAILLAGVLTSPMLVRALTDTNEIWISSTNSSLGSGIHGYGTLVAPFYGDFDVIINTNPPNTTIHLLPGVFYTLGSQPTGGGQTLKAYQKVIGAGRGNTIVQRADTNNV